MDQEYGKRYRTLWESHWWWRARTEYIVDAIRRYRPATGWTSILDVGCGDGLFFERLAEFGQVEGVEPCRQLVSPDNASRIYICPFDENFQPRKRYSLVLMLDVLEHLEHPVAALRHAMNLLAPGGTFIATVPAFMTLWTNHDILNHHFTRYTKRSLRQVAQKAGMTIREERYLFHWVFPIKVGVGLAERALALKPKAPIISNSLLNRFMYGLSRLEQKTLSRLPMPFGSSLLAVGGKTMPVEAE